MSTLKREKQGVERYVRGGWKMGETVCIESEEGEKEGGGGGGRGGV